MDSKLRKNRKSERQLKPSNLQPLALGDLSKAEEHRQTRCGKWPRLPTKQQHLSLVSVEQSGLDRSPGLKQHLFGTKARFCFQLYSQTFPARVGPKSK